MAKPTPALWPVLLAMEQRPAGVPGVDGRVDLDDRFDRAVAVNLQRPIQTGDDSGRQRALQAEGIADRKHPHSDFQIGRIAERDGKQLIGGGFDSNDRHIIDGVGSHEGRIVGLAGMDRDGDLLGPLDHMVIREDVPFLIEDASRAGALARNFEK
jgi:hypothetical protein